MKNTDQEIEAALVSTGGLVSTAAKKLGVTRQAIQYRITENPDLRDFLKEVREANLDFAEEKLLERIRDGHPQCIIFFLRTLGKDRGYVERMEQTGKNGKEIVAQKAIDLPPLPANYKEWQRQRAVNPLAAEALDVEEAEVKEVTADKIEAT
jgi:hypothetical protein